MRPPGQHTGLFAAAARAAACCAAAATLAAAAAACGSLTAGQGGTAAGGRSGHKTRGCTAAGVRVIMDSAAAGVAAGSSFVPLDFTNVSGRRCVLTGYPVVSFAASAAGRQVGTAAAVDRAVRARRVLLAPGATAHAWLQVTDAMNIPASRCHPVTAGGIRVGLPGEHDASYLSHVFAACSAVTDASQLLSIQPIQPGRAHRGTAG